MNKLKYDSIYKFIVSIGIAITCLPGVFSAWFFNRNEILFIKESELVQLTQSAQNVINIEQKMIFIIFNNMFTFFVISVLISISGIMIVVYGLIQWNNRVQKKENKSVELSNKLMESQIINMTKEEKEEKVKEEIKQYSIVKDSNEDKIIYTEKLNKYTEIQNQVVAIISKCFDGYKVFDDIKIDKEQYDCIVQREKVDYIFEIKYVSDIKLLKSRISKISKQAIERYCKYYDNTDRSARSFTIIVIDELNDKIELENKKIFSLIEKENKDNRYFHKILISDIKNIYNQLSNIKY